MWTINRLPVRFDSRSTADVRNTPMKVSLLNNHVCGVPDLPTGVDVSVLDVDDAEVSVDDRHARFTVYCVKLGALNVTAVSLIFVCTPQTA